MSTRLQVCVASRSVLLTCVLWLASVACSAGGAGTDEAGGGANAEGGAGGTDAVTGGTGSGAGGTTDPSTGGTAGVVAGQGGSVVAVGEVSVTGADPLPPPAPAFPEAPVFAATFSDAQDLQQRFAVTEGADAVAVEGGALRINAAKAATLVVDTTPASAPGDVYAGDLTIEFRVKGDTTPLVPSTGVTVARAVNEAWVAFPQGDRANAPQVSFRWGEAVEDSISLRTGTDVSNSRTAGTRVGGIIFATPVWSGDVWYTIRVVIKTRAGGQATVYAQIFDGPDVALATQQTLSGLTATGEVAIGGMPGIGGRPSPLLIDDVRIWKKAAAVEEDKNEYFQTAVNGLAAVLWVPPGLAKINGLFVETPGSGGDTSRSPTFPWYQDFAAMHGYAVLGHAEGLDPAGISRAIEALGTLSKHEELKSVPIAAYGFSRGARNVVGMTESYPSRLVTFVADASPLMPTTNATAQKLPGVFVYGEQDSIGGGAMAFLAAQKRNRMAGGHVGVLEKQGLGHTPTSTYFFFLPYFDAMLRALHSDATRPPTPVKEEDAWLLQAGGWKASMFPLPAPMVSIAPLASYQGDKNNTGWFANRDVAYLAAAYTGFSRALVVSPMPHAQEGASRTVRVRVLPDFAAFEKIEIYDLGKLLHTFKAGEPLVHKYETLSKGVHSIAAHMTFQGKVFVSFPTMLIAKARP